jgi:hypothetical protein
MNTRALEKDSQQLIGPFPRNDLAGAGIEQRQRATRPILVLTASSLRRVEVRLAQLIIPGLVRA